MSVAVLLVLLLPLLLLLPHVTLLGYYFASNIVLGETMMPVSFSPTTGGEGQNPTIIYPGVGKQ